MKKLRLRPWRSRLYRVVRRGWADPLDTSFSRLAPDRRWNSASFEALYCCGSEAVARAVTLDLFRFAGIVAEDLQEAARPQLAEIEWRGELVDVYSAEGVEAGGFPPEYPSGAGKDQTRAAAERWRRARREGVMCRSASLARMGQTAWPEPAEPRCEVALWPGAWVRKPKLIARREGEEWLRAAAAHQA